MTGGSLFATVAAAHLLAVMSPGPDFAVVTRQTLMGGRAAGIWTALGIGSGICFHVAWAMFGLGWVVARLPVVLELMRYAGAAFLLWFGLRALRAQPAPVVVGDTAAPVARRSALGDYGVGLATNILNPKAMLFFVALCSAVITQDTPIVLRLAVGLWMVLTTAAWFSLVSVTLGHPGVRARLRAQAHWIDRAMGALLIALAAWMLA